MDRSCACTRAYKVAPLNNTLSSYGALTKHSVVMSTLNMPYVCTYMYISSSQTILNDIKRVRNRHLFDLNNSDYQYGHGMSRDTCTVYVLCTDTAL